VELLISVSPLIRTPSRFGFKSKRINGHDNVMFSIRKRVVEFQVWQIHLRGMVDGLYDVFELATCARSFVQLPSDVRYSFSFAFRINSFMASKDSLPLDPIQQPTHAVP
jgi:hypothetical protein